MQLSLFYFTHTARRTILHPAKLLEPSVHTCTNDTFFNARLNKVLKQQAHTRNSSDNQMLWLLKASPYRASSAALGRNKEELSCLFTLASLGLRRAQHAALWVLSSRVGAPHATPGRRRNEKIPSDASCTCASLGFFALLSFFFFFFPGDDWLGNIRSRGLSLSVVALAAIFIVLRYGLLLVVFYSMFLFLFLIRKMIRRNVFVVWRQFRWWIKQVSV